MCASSAEGFALPRELELTMKANFASGFSLIPISPDCDGKSASVKFSGRRRLPLKRVVEKMRQDGSEAYAIRLDGLVVLDLDEDEPALVAKLEARFGAASVHVKTPRGRHMYYRVGTCPLPNLKAEGVRADVKRGGGAYVLGPGSVRSDGGVYNYSKGDLSSSELTALGDTPQSVRTSNQDRVPQGKRHKHLVAFAIQHVSNFSSAEALAEGLMKERDQKLTDPTSVSDKEVTSIAAWAVDQFQQGNLYQQLGGAIAVPKPWVAATSDHPAAMFLLVYLLRAHGLQRNRKFPLVFSAMWPEKTKPLSERAFHGARRLLINLGIIEIAESYSVGVRPNTYRFCRN